MSETQFAYGDDEVKGCKCPAAAAGYRPTNGDDSSLIAADFDWEVERIHDAPRGAGTISEEKAKEAWKKTVENHESSGNEEQVRIGVEIAEAIGWEIDE